MPRPSRPWFRWYVEAVYDRKLRRIPGEQRWVFVACCTVARQSPEPGVLLVGDDPAGWDDLVDVAALPMRTVKAGMKSLTDAGIVARDEERGCWFLPAWAARQFESDNVTDRTRKHRSQPDRRNVPTSFPGTDQRTEAETDTELRESESELHPAHRSSRLSPFEPSEDHRTTAAKFVPWADVDAEHRTFVAHAEAHGLSFVDVAHAFTEWLLKTRKPAPDTPPSLSSVPVEREFCDECGSSTGFTLNDAGAAVPCPACNPKAAAG